MARSICLPSTVALDDPYNIFNLFFNEKTLTCVSCLYTGRTEPPIRPRNSLLELSINSV